MPSYRFESIEQIESHSRLKINGYGEQKIIDFFGCNVFNQTVMQEYLKPEVFQTLKETIESGTKLKREIADEIAVGMKAWAASKGVTHYAHWFQPLTGSTAEKHDSFFTLEPDGTPIEHFSGSTLIQQEPDASSFPTGGIRATFEARGYTAWDPASSAFIVENANGKTLCIPTIFIAYNGESLDYKGPLLKSIEVLNKAAVAVCQYFDKKITKTTVTLGWEQEYFVIDEGMANARPDLIQCGRTLMGHSPSKGQQLDDHYFGSIPERQFAFMQDFEQEAYKLGIPLRTRHNEVAPSQFECAPIFEEVNIAADHNALLMDIMNKIAKRHKLKVLFHEKPFAGVNGSGKHNNWSMSTNTGLNLLSPGKDPKHNLLFLTFFINTIKAVFDHADLLRAAIASPGNDYRLGAHEAPPAIISVFVGDYLSKVLHEIEGRNQTEESDPHQDSYRLNLHGHIPEVTMDNTDRNRTSPFAFTGNKFEFRAVGSSANCAEPMSTLNSIVADTLIKFKQEVDKKINEGTDQETAILQVLKEFITIADPVLFEGDNYSDEWKEEAKRRGLANFASTPEALEVLSKSTTTDLFERLGIYTKRELAARHEIVLSNYIKKIQIEARVLGDLSLNHILPAAIKYQNILIKNVKGLQELGMNPESYASQQNAIERISNHIQAITNNTVEMIRARKVANKLTDYREAAFEYLNHVKSKFDIIRYHVDKLELLVDDDLWPMPKYREMLFLS